MAGKKKNDTQYVMGLVAKAMDPMVHWLATGEEMPAPVAQDFTKASGEITNHTPRKPSERPACRRRQRHLGLKVF